MEDAPHIDAPRVTYDLLRRFCNSFGLTDDAVPYTTDTHDAIDFARILELHP